MGTVFLVLVVSGFSYLGALKGENAAKSRLALEGQLDKHIQSVRSTLQKVQEPLFTLSDIVAISRGGFKDFGPYARYLLSTNINVAGLFLAPDGVVLEAEPLQGNEGAIGHELLKDPDRKREVEEAIATNSTVLAGPVNMRQGGVGLFARKPVFWLQDNGQRHFWGLVIALIKWDTIKTLLDFESLSSAGYAYRLERKLGTDPHPVLLMRSNENVLDDAAASRSFAIPGGEWILTLSEKQDRLQVQLFAGYFVVLVGAVLCSILIFNVLTSSHKVRMQAVALSDMNDVLSIRLKEREILLKEVHHRVKNNLQIIASLLDLQSLTVDNQDFNELVTACKDRIKAIALAHEQLYRSDNLSNVEAREYFEGITRNILQGATGLLQNLQCTVEAPPVNLSLGRAVSLGLILTELVTNALKHAFKDVGNPHIVISFEVGRDEVATLTVRDNGIGFPDGRCPDTVSSLGIVLVKSLANQLNGQMKCANLGGATVMVSFPMARQPD